jgi:glycosyltransferase involved in cell wall biosynthesis/GT2 family glycosyltransferase/SAM-dependent methyltransferase
VSFPSPRAAAAVQRDPGFARVANLVPASARRVLHVGCGRGIAALLLKLQSPACIVVGVPDQPGELHAAAERCDEIVLPSALGGVPPDSFDCIIASSVLDRAARPAAALRSLLTLLEPGGALVLEAPSSAHALVLAVGSGAKAERKHGFTRRALVELLDECGCDLTSIRLDLERSTPDKPVLAMRHAGSRLEEIEEAFGPRLFATAVYAASPRQIPVCSVIVRPAGPAARTLAALRRECARTDLEVLAAEGRTAADLNRAARAARGRYLAFLDAGSVPAPGWLAALIRALRTTPDAAVAASTVVDAGGAVLHAGFALFASDLPYRHYPVPIGQALSGEAGVVPSVGTDGMLIERSVFIRHAGFDERFEDDLFDADLCLRLRAHGRVAVCSAAGVVRKARNAKRMRRREGSEPPGHRYFGDKWSPLLESKRIGEPVDERPWQPRLPLPAERSATPALVWSGHIFGPGGYSESTRNFITALDRAGVHTLANPFSSNTPSTFDEAIEFDRFVVAKPPESFVSIVSRPGIFYRRQMQERIAIGRTMNETDRIPAGWVTSCNQMDQIWVPSHFNLEAFAHSGVDRRRLFVVPETIDERLYHRDVEPLEIENVSGFVFLSVFLLGPRKGWKLLLEAYLDEFRRDEDVTLLLRISQAVHSPFRAITEFLSAHLGGDPSRGPRIVLCPSTVGGTLMPRLFRTADAFVLPSRGEGWGRPYMEAMASGLATIGTGWSGNTEFMDRDNSYLIDYELVPHNDPSLPPNFHTPEHTLWALPSVVHLRQLMRTVFENREAAAKTGARARESVLDRFRHEKVARIIVDRLRESGVEPAMRSPAPSAQPRREPGTPAIAPVCSVVLRAGLDPARTKVCIDTLDAAASQFAWELIVVGSGNARTLRSRAAARTVVERARGSSPESAWNAGARCATGEYVVFLDDGACVRAGWMEALVDGIGSTSGNFVAGSALVARDGSLLHAGLAYGPELLPYPPHRGLAPAVDSVTRPMPAVSATGMIAATRHFTWAGGFDETLEGNLAAADLCLRLRELGGDVVCCAGSVIEHDELAAAGDRRDEDVRRRFLEKWAPSIRPDDERVCRDDGLDVIAVRSGSCALPARGRRRVRRAPAVLWTAPVFDRSGYANEARDYVLALDEAGVDVAVNPMQWPLSAPGLPQPVARRLRALATREMASGFVHVIQHQAIRFARHHQAAANIGRTMFETDTLPRDRVERCNAMDELWVPSSFNVETFTRAGVDPARLVVIPEAIDAELYRRRVRPLRIPDARGFVFLSVFAWSIRKGWDVLLRAYVEEFRRDESVTLVLAVSTSATAAPVDPAPLVAKYLREQLGCEVEDASRIVVLPLALGPGHMPGLYAAADAFVLPSRGEGWGRPYMEAMACGLPTIGTGWSGNTEFMNDGNSFLIDSELVPLPDDGWARHGMFRGHRWAAPSTAHLRSLLRRVYEDRTGSRRIGARARREVLELYDRRRIAAAMIRRIRTWCPR